MSSRHHLAELRSLPPQIAPSMLLCDFGNLQREVERLEAAGARLLHLDVMDGHFVPNFTYGLSLVEAFRKLTRLPLDVHLMISNPDQYVERFVQAGADIVTFHAEATLQPRLLLEKIQAMGAGAGVAINPDTPLTAIEGCLDICDLALVMSVQAGFGGQRFQPVALEKLRNLAARGGPRVLLEVDGGVNAGTLRACVEAGAQLLVVGSAIFNHEDYTAQIGRLRNLVEPKGATLE